MFTNQHAMSRSRGAAFAISVLLHMAVLLILLTLSADLTKPPSDARPLMFDLPVVLPPELAIVLEPVVPEVGEASEAAEGGGGGSIAKALRTRPVIAISPVELPTPVVDLALPFAVVVPTAPLEGPFLDGTVGVGVGTGAGAGGGAGDGVGQGTGLKTGEGTGSGAGLDRRQVANQAAEWIVRPTFEQMEAAYPFAARYNKVAGSVVLSCQVKNQRPKGCKVVREGPAGYGFGKAAIDVVYKGRIKAPVIEDQDPATVRVSIPIVFEQQ